MNDTEHANTISLSVCVMALLWFCHWEIVMHFRGYNLSLELT